MIPLVQNGNLRKKLIMDEDFQLGFILNLERTEKIIEISHVFDKSPEQFINDIIDSTYKKIEALTLEWDQDDE